MKKNDFATLFMLTRKARAEDRVIRPAELTRVLDLYDRVRHESALAMIARWQRDPDYLNAVRVLSAGKPESSPPDPSDDPGSM